MLKFKFLAYFVYLIVMRSTILVTLNTIVLRNTISQIFSVNL